MKNINEYKVQAMKYDSRLVEAVKQNNGEKVRKIVREIKDLTSSMYTSNSSELRKFLKEHTDNSLLTGAMHTAYFMEKGMPIMSDKKTKPYFSRKSLSEEVKYFGLGLVSLFKERGEKINYDFLDQYKFAVVNGKDIQLRKNFIETNKNIITKLYNSGEGEKLRNQIKIINEANKNPKISFSTKEVAKTLLTLSDPLLTGAFSTMYLKSSNTPVWSGITHLEFGGLGIEHIVKSGFGKGLTFDENQMHFSKTNFHNAIKNENSFKGAEFVGEESKKRLMKKDENVDVDSPFLFDNSISRFEFDNTVGGKKPSLDEIEGKRDFDGEYELKYGTFFPDED